MELSAQCCNGRLAIFRIENITSCDEVVRSCVAAEFRCCGIDAAIHLDHEILMCGASLFDFREDIADESLAAEAGVHGHQEQEIDAWVRVRVGVGE